MNIKGITLTLLLILYVSHGIDTQTPAYSAYSKSTMLGTQVKLSFEIVTIGSDKYAKFLLEKFQAGFVAFGIGSSMSSADIVVIERINNQITLNDCRLNGQEAPICGESEQAWSFYKSQLESSELTPSSMKVEFKRKVDASGSDSDKSISQTGSTTFIYSYTTNDRVAQHDDTGEKGVVNIDLSSGETSKFARLYGACGFFAIATLSIIIFV